MLLASKSFFESSVLYSYFRREGAAEFIEENLFIPQLVRYLEITDRKIKEKVTWMKTDEAYFFDDFKKKMEKKVNHAVSVTVERINGKKDGKGIIPQQTALLYEPHF